MTDAKKNEIAKELLPLLVSKLMPSYSASYLLDRLEEIISGLEERGYFEEETYPAGLAYDPKSYDSRDYANTPPELFPRFKHFIYTTINQDSKD
jgi:hypothetical protein